MSLVKVTGLLAAPATVLAGSPANARLERISTTPIASTLTPMLRNIRRCNLASIIIRSLNPLVQPSFILHEINRPSGRSDSPRRAGLRPAKVNFLQGALGALRPHYALVLL